MMTIEQATAGIDDPMNLPPRALSGYWNLITEYLASPRYAEFQAQRALFQLTTDQLATNPCRRVTTPDLLRWMRETEVGPWAPQRRTAPSLPTSPRDAFPTRAAAVVAMERWGRDADPRLAGGTGGHYRRPADGGEITDWSDRFAQEAETGWGADDFYFGTQLALGFWSDVRTLGYGTPYWIAINKETTVTTLPAGTTAMPIGPDHPGWNEWWSTLRAHAVAGGYLAQFRTLAAAMGYVEPRQYRVTLVVTADRPLRTDEALAYMIEHPDSVDVDTLRSI